MANTISLCLSTDHLRLQVRGRQASLLGLRRAQAAGKPLQLPYSDRVEGGSNLGSTLVQGLRALTQDALGKSADFRDAELEVALGASHARLGVLALDAQMAASDRNALVTAWTMQTWNIVPEQHILRFGAVNSFAKYGLQDILVSCISKSLFDTIHTVCTQEQLRFTSCTPALLSELPDLLRSEAGSGSRAHTAMPASVEAIAVFQEAALTGTGGHMAQFVALRAGSVLSISRQWFGAEDVSLHAKAMEQTLARLRLQHGLQTAPRTIAIAWPARLPGGAEV